MTETRILKSRMRQKSHVRSESGGGIGDRPADHDNLGIDTPLSSARLKQESIYLQ